MQGMIKKTNYVIIIIIIIEMTLCLNP